MLEGADPGPGHRAASTVGARTGRLAGCSDHAQLDPDRDLSLDRLLPPCDLHPLVRLMRTQGHGAPGHEADRHLRRGEEHPPIRRHHPMKEDQHTEQQSPHPAEERTQAESRGRRSLDGDPCGAPSHEGGREQPQIDRPGRVTDLPAADAVSDWIRESMGLRAAAVLTLGDVFGWQVPHHVTWPAMSSRIAGPIPRTPASSSSEPKGP
ncbi:hypothetical protein GCM10009674_00380 [Nesterenkonia xinjiangensis]